MNIIFIKILNAINYILPLAKYTANQQTFISTIWATFKQAIEYTLFIPQ
jgi:hypothetical protein